MGYNYWFFYRRSGGLGECMRLIRGLHNLNALANRDDSPFAKGCVATIGNFDGVHRGHREIIDQVRERARRLRVPAAVVLFEPQPREYFQGWEAPARLMRFREKVDVLDRLGVDLVVCLQFNRRLRELSAGAFIDQVVEAGMRARHLVVGDDFRFGCDRAGDFALLEQVGHRDGFAVEHTRTVEWEGRRVSSSRVRAALEKNDLPMAAGLLGRPYGIRGRVVHGRRLGRQIGAPTANILLGPQRPPLQGVYVVEVRLADGSRRGGVANIGLRPTVDGTRPALEVHLFAFTGKLYGQRIEVIFLHPLRDEVRFPDIEALQRQIASDIEQAQSWLRTHPQPFRDWPKPLFNSTDTDPKT